MPLAVLRRMIAWIRAALAVFVVSSVGVGCTSQLVCESPVEPCVQTGGPTEAAVTAVAAGALWAGGGGCAIAGCRYPMVCNEGSGLCEHMRCGEHVGGCPPATRCEPTTYTCQ
jgi:hypothetical protein